MKIGQYLTDISTQETTQYLCHTLIFLLHILYMILHCTAIFALTHALLYYTSTTIEWLPLCNESQCHNHHISYFNLALKEIHGDTVSPSVTVHLNLYACCYHHKQSCTVLVMVSDI